MKRDSYSDQHAHASFQPRSPQSADDSTQLSQPVHHSSSSSDLGSKWLNKASRWVADKFQTAQNLMGSGEAIASDQILPALRGTANRSLSQSAQSDQPLVGVIDSGFGANEHGSKMVEAIQQENPQAKIWRGGGVGTGGWSESLVKFVDTAKAGGHSRAVANLSFDLTEVHPDGSTSNRSQLTANEQSALAYARDNGVLVVASAGNQGGAMSALGQASQPFDNLIVVGAANGSDRASYSSYGKGLDLVADVGTAGTSLAAAKTTGAIAKLWSDNPELSSQQVNQLLTATATDLKAPGWDTETGAGLLNTTGAIDLATHTTPKSIVLSGAQLAQQSNLSKASLNSRAWTSTNGAIASERPNWDWSDVVHGALDVAGFIPGAGAVADLANAGLYAIEGDYANAALSAGAAVPGFGDTAAAVKLANRGVEAMQVANRGADATQDIAARAIPSPPPSSRPQNPAPEPTPPSRPGQPELERPPATPERQQPVPERSGSPGAAPRSGTGGFTRAVAATTAVATVAPYVAPIVSEEDPRPNPSGSDPNPVPDQPTQPYPGPTPTQQPSPPPVAPSPTPTQPPSDQPNLIPGQITMGQGDTLWGIAQEHLGSGARWTDILKADGSPFTEQEASSLQVGTIVQLPPTPTPLPPSPPQTPTPDTPISPSPTSPDPKPTTVPSPSPGPTNPMPVPTPNTPISPSPTLPDPTPATIPSPSPSSIPISPNSTPTHSPWSPLPAETPDLTPHTPDTRDLKHGVELTNSNQAQMPENTGETPGDEPEASPGSSEGETEPSQDQSAGGDNSPSASNSEPNDQSKPLSIPTSIDASKLLPKKAIPEDIATLQKFLDQHPELMPEEIRSEATTPFGKREIWELLRAMGINPEALQLPNWRDTGKMRREPGVAVGGETLPDTDYLFQPLDNQGKQRAPIGLIPGQIARQLRGKHFKDFAEFRATFWKLVAQDSKLSLGWEDPENLKRMNEGKAPYAPRNGRTGKEISYQLDHSDDLQYGGGVYDIDSIRIVTPRFHDEYGK